MAIIATLVFAMCAPGAYAVAPFSVSFLVNNLENGGSGKVVIDVHPEWAPKSAERFAELVRQNFFNEMRFFKVITGFSAHFGVPANSHAMEEWRSKGVVDDAHVESNHRGRISFVTDEDSPTELVVSMKDNEFFDRKGYAAFGEVVEGMFFFDRLQSRYGSKPVLSKIEKEGNAYLTKEFPQLSHIEHVALVERNPDLVLSIQSELPAVTGSQSLYIALGMSVFLAAIWFHIARSGADGVIKV